MATDSGRRAANIANQTPKYALHTAAARAYVRMNGKFHYLGEYDSHERYERLIAQWLGPNVQRRQGNAHNLPAQHHVRGLCSVELAAVALSMSSTTSRGVRLRSLPLSCGI